MNKLKLFLSNFLIYGLGGIIGKIIPFIMLPIITKLMPDTRYFGLNELVNTMVSIGSAVAIMGMYDACFRLFFDKEDLEFQKTVCSTALVFTIATSIIVATTILVFQDFVTMLVFGDLKYKILLYIADISILMGSTNAILAIPCRVLNRRRVFVIMNLSTAIVAYAISIPLLIKGYYLIAIPLAAVISVILNGLVFLWLNFEWFNPYLFSQKLLNELLIIAVPLLPIFIIYWIFNSCDRLTISQYLGNSQLGVYSIGAKVASASQLIYTAFAGGWQYFAFSTMNEDRQVENNSKVYEYLGVISFVAVSFFCVICKDSFEYFFYGEYVKGYIVAPLLFMGPLLLMLYQVAGNQFLVVKKTVPGLIILSCGAIVNVCLNTFLVPIFGIEGAALANLTAYIVVNIICCIVLQSMKLFIVSKRFVLVSLITVWNLIAWRAIYIDNIIIGILFFIIYIFIIMNFYNKELRELLNKKLI